MNTLLELAPAVVLAGYTLTCAGYAVLFFTGREWARTISPWILKGTIVVHGLLLAGITLRWGQFPAVTVSQALSVVSFAIAVVYVFLEWLGGDRTSGFWLVGQIWLFSLLSVLAAGGPPPRRELFDQPLFGVHVGLALLGYAAFAVAASYGFLFLRLYRELKKGRFTVFYGKLPPLEILERMMNGALVVGFVALTGSLVDGALWVSQADEGNWLTDPMVLLSLGTWGLYGVALLLRKMQRWQGRQTALASLAGLSVILASLVVVRVFLQGFHRVS